MRSMPADLTAAAPGIGSRLAALAAVLGRAAAQLCRAAVQMWHDNPLEGTVVALLILAGLTYPFPIWLLGFGLWTAGILLSMPSKIWDPTDKWVGLATPVVVAVIGSLVALATGGSHDSARAYGHEVGSVGPPLLKAAVVLGAVYLAWRARRGRRSPAVPPWNRAHRI